MSPREGLASRIFKWYQTDFGIGEGSVAQFIARYHVEGEYITKNLDGIQLKYLDYDWGLNKAEKRTGANR